MIKIISGGVVVLWLRFELVAVIRSQDVLTFLRAVTSRPAILRLINQRKVK